MTVASKGLVLPVLIIIFVAIVHIVASLYHWYKGMYFIALFSTCAALPSVYFGVMTSGIDDFILGDRYD